MTHTDTMDSDVSCNTHARFLDFATVGIYIVVFCVTNVPKELLIAHDDTTKA